MRAVWVHDNCPPMSKPLPLITPADGKYWIFTFAYSILASPWRYESIWIGGPADRACPQLPTNPSVDPAFINILTSLFPKKVSKQIVMGEAPPTLPMIHTSTNRAQWLILVQDHFYSGDIQLCALESTHFKWHFSCNTPLCKYQNKAVGILTWLKRLFFYSYCSACQNQMFKESLAWGMLPNITALFTWIMRPQWMLQCSILWASELGNSQWQSGCMFSTVGITRIDFLVWLAQ